MIPKIVVLKVGGSLFVQPQLADRLQAYVSRLADELAPVHLVLIVGGGVLVDAIRAIDRVNALSSDFAHWAAIELMEVSADLLRHFLPNLHSTSNFEELRLRCSNIGATQFRTSEFLRIHEPNLPGTRVPVGWNVTSDSIAARVAEVLNADELILLKSTDGSRIPDWQTAVEAGFVDPFFPALAGNLAAVRTAVLPRL